MYFVWFFDFAGSTLLLLCHATPIGVFFEGRAKNVVRRVQDYTNQGPNAEELIVGILDEIFL
jgi:hypothetical protein